MATENLTIVKYTLIKFPAILFLMEGLCPLMNYFAFSSFVDMNALANLDKLVNLDSYLATVILPCNKFMNSILSASFAV